MKMKHEIDTDASAAGAAAIAAAAASAAATVATTVKTVVKTKAAAEAAAASVLISCFIFVFDFQILIYDLNSLPFNFYQDIAPHTPPINKTALGPGPNQAPDMAIGLVEAGYDAFFNDFETRRPQDGYIWSKIRCRS